MNFRECVIDCITRDDVVESFNRLHQAAITDDLLSRLKLTGEQLPLVGLADEQQELLASFILFVHRHIWRKVKFAQSRVTRANSEHSLSLDVSRLELVTEQRGSLHG